MLQGLNVQMNSGGVREEGSGVTNRRQQARYSELEREDNKKG